MDTTPDPTITRAQVDATVTALERHARNAPSPLDARVETRLHQMQFERGFDDYRDCIYGVPTVERQEREARIRKHLARIADETAYFEVLLEDHLLQTCPEQLPVNAWGEVDWDACVDRDQIHLDVIRGALVVGVDDFEDRETLLKYFTPARPGKRGTAPRKASTVRVSHGRPQPKRDRVRSPIRL